MSDQDDKDGGGLSLDLEADDLEWDDALKEWEDELKADGLVDAGPVDAGAAAETVTDGAPGGSSSVPPAQTSSAPPSRPSQPAMTSLFDDEGELLPTRISEVPEKVTAALMDPDADMDLALDDLLSGLDDEPRGAEAEQLASAPADIAELVALEVEVPRPKPPPPPPLRPMGFKPRPASAFKPKAPSAFVPRPPDTGGPTRPPPPPNIPSKADVPSPPRARLSLDRLRKKPAVATPIPPADDEPTPVRAALADGAPTAAVGLADLGVTREAGLAKALLDAEAPTAGDEFDLATPTVQSLPDNAITDEGLSELDAMLGADVQGQEIVIDDDAPTEDLSYEDEPTLEEMTDPPSRPPPAKASLPAENDAGAVAAARTVRYRKPREEHFPLVGRTPDAIRCRRDLLVHLGERSEGSSKARLCVSAAELSEQIGEADRAQALYALAREADPRDVIALRESRREAFARDDWEEVANLLQAEAGLALSPEDRASAMSLLAEVQLSRLHDVAAAEKTARASLLRQTTISNCLLLAETCIAQNRPAEAMTALDKAAEGWHDGPAKAMLKLFVARSAEKNGQTQRALDFYRAAAEANPGSLASHAGVARCSRASGDTEAAVTATLRAAELIGEGAGAEAFHRAAAQLVHYRLERPADAVAILSEARGINSLRARAAAAAAAGDMEVQMASVEAWASASGGTERALALVTLAELLAESGDMDGADEALRDAALADNTLGTIRVVREVLARKAGDTGRLARAVGGGTGGGTALAAAAKLARNPGDAGRERELIAEAQRDGESPVTADVLALDSAAELSDEGAILAGLRRQVERAEPQLKVGALLAMADMAGRAGDSVAAEVLLGEARDLDPGDPLVLRPLANIRADKAPLDSAAAWLEESSTTDGARSAFAATVAGRLLQRAGSDPVPAYRRALDSLQTYGPAAWALEPISRARGDGATLAELNESQAEQSVDPTERAGRLIRAALLRATDDPAAAAALLSQAREANSRDSILYELMLRLGSATSPAEKAVLLLASAEDAPEDVQRTARIRAAGVFEDLDDPAQAASIYRQVLDTNQEDPIALHALDRAELAAREVARVAERRFVAVKAAADDESRVHALQQLADLDLYERVDPGAAVLSLQSILEVAPGHLPSLRTLERYFMDHGRDDDLLGVEQALAQHLRAPTDIAAHTRAAARLMLRAEEAPGNAADDLLLMALDRTEDGWIARRAVAAAEARGDARRQAHAARLVAEGEVDPIGRASLAVRASAIMDFVGETEAAIALLRGSVLAAPSHPGATEQLAELLEESGAPEDAAAAWEQAAQAAGVKRHIAALWYKAGICWQERVGNEERAIAAFSSAAEVDTTHLDVFDRLKRLRQEQGNLSELASLTEQRIQAGGDPAVLVDLNTALAELREKMGDRTGARESLRAALAIEPDRAQALRHLANLSLEDEDWRGAAESLIRIARLTKDREELRWVFFTLGEIYDAKMPDARRAEAAYKRVLKLIPQDLDALERLANLHEREGNMAAAVTVLETLAQHEVDPDKNREFHMRLATSLEQGGDPRRAEAVLEQTRKNAPTDPIVLRAMADLYGRQNAQAALSMHLNRAIQDFRHAIATDASDAAAWHGLVEVLEWRGRMDAARACASAATALGVTDVDIQKLVSTSGAAPGAGRAAAEPELEDLLAPRELTRVTRAVFRMAGDALEKMAPFDLKHLRADKVGRNDSFRKAALEAASWFGVSDVQVWVTDKASRVCVPLSASPLSILIGTDLQQATGPEKLFLATRAIKIAQSSLSVAVRTQPAVLTLAVAGLVRAFDPNFAPPGIEPAQLEDAARRAHKSVNRRASDELMPLIFEMAGAPGFDPSRLGLHASELGDRIALVATGDVPAAVSALMRLANVSMPGSAPTAQRVEAIRKVPEAATLMDFALSDQHFDARHRTGADGR